MRYVLAFVVGILMATAATSYAGGSYFVPGVTTSSQNGYAYDTTTGRFEVNLDQHAPDCRGLETTVVISADRNRAQVSCKDLTKSAEYSSALPVFLAGSQFSIVWRR